MHNLTTAIIIIIHSVFFFNLITLISLICLLYYKNIKFCTVVSSKYNNNINTESSEAELPAL